MKIKLLKNKLTNVVLILVFNLVLSSCGDQAPQVALTAADYPESGSEQSQLYLEKCGSCHAAPLPTIHSEKQWFGVVQRMQFRMTNKAIKPLNEEELDIIIAYLQKHARKE